MKIGYGFPAERRQLLRAGVKPDNLHIDEPGSRCRPCLELAIKDCRHGDVLFICNYDRLGTRQITFNAVVRRLCAKATRIRIAKAGGRS